MPINYKKRSSLARLSRYIQLMYYQYEVTFSGYVLSKYCPIYILLLCQEVQKAPDLFKSHLNMNFVLKTEQRQAKTWS